MLMNVTIITLIDGQTCVDCAVIPEDARTNSELLQEYVIDWLEDNRGYCDEVIAVFEGEMRSMWPK